MGINTSPLMYESYNPQPHLTANAPNKKAKSKSDKKSAAAKEEQSMENCDIISKVGYIAPTN